MNRNLIERARKTRADLNSLVLDPATDAGLRCVAEGLLLMFQLSRRHRRNNRDAFDQILELSSRQGSSVERSTESREAKLETPNPSDALSSESNLPKN